MENLYKALNQLKTDYQKIFFDTAREIEDFVKGMKPKSLEGEIFDNYLEGSIGKAWQENVLKYFKETVEVKICSDLSEIKSLREEYSCIGCGSCCRFACSEFSYEQLTQKAASGDNYAKQFISVFKPYDSLEEVKSVYPQYVEFLGNCAEGAYYFYHCPKVTEDNRCPDYDNRPQICRDFPDNPIAFLPPKCGFCDWKLKSERVLLKLNALAEIVEFYKSKIKGNM